MKPAPFAYAKARSLDHAIALLDGAPEREILAGGQSLVPALNMRLSTPSLLVDINGLRELGQIARRNGQIELGALVRHAQAERSSAVAQFGTAARAGDPAHCPSGDSQPRYHRRVDRACRPGGGTARLPPGARRRDRHGRPRRSSAASRPTYFFKGLFETALGTATCSPPFGSRCPRSARPLRLRRTGAPARRLCAGRARRGGARAWRRSCASSVSPISGWANADPRPPGRNGARSAATSTRAVAALQSRSLAAQRRARQRRHPASSGRRAVASRRRATGSSTHDRSSSRRVSRSTASACDAEVEPRQNLVDFLREELQLTGSHVGCEHGVCGACTVRVDGTIVRGCLMLAVQCDGAVIETIEGVSDSGDIADLQAAFCERNALQCGFCTPGMLLTAQELLAPKQWRAVARCDPRRTCREITVAAPAITRSSTQSKRSPWRATRQTR